MNTASHVSLLLLSLTAALISESQARDVNALDDDWRFQLGDNPQATARDFADNALRVVNLPHDWSIEGTTSADAPSLGDGGYFPTGVGWYRKELASDPSWRDKRVWLDFEGVATTCEVWLNGKKLGGHHYAYTPIHFDITEHLEFDKPNVIAVRVDNSHQPNSRWYTGSGIYRHVGLTVTEPVYVEHNTFRLTTRATDRFPPPEGKIKTLTARVVNKSNQSRDVRVEFIVLDSNGQLAVQDHDNVSVMGTGLAIGSMDFDASNLQMWSPNSPNLYTAMVRIVADEQVLDESSFRFGIRTVEVSSDKGFLLNGKPIELRGACVHHDNGPLGAAAFDRAEERRVELLKAAGFNAIRTSHNPPSVAFLDACDRLGMLVVDEAFDGWAAAKREHDYSTVFEKEWHNDLRAMFKRDGNHPSVVMWSIGNEVFERGNEKGLKLARQLSKNARTFGFGRPVTIALNGLEKGEDWPKLDPMFAAVDVAGYNYELARHAADHTRIPKRIVMCTESFPSAVFEGWDSSVDHPYVIGDFVWSGIDYLGEAGIGRVYPAGETQREHWEGTHFPSHGGTCGDLDITGWRKPLSYYRQIVWDAGEKLYMAVEIPAPDGKPWQLSKWAHPPLLSSWTWPGHEGKSLRVEVFSRCDAVKLYLNGKLIGEKPTKREEEFRARFTVPYEPGVLKAVGVENGKEVETFEIFTAGPPSQLRLKPDRTTIHADGQDLSFVTVEVTDEQGHWCPNADESIEYELAGPGSITAVGSGDLSSRETYQANPRRSYQGRALVVVRSAKTPGKLTLTARAAGLKSVSVEIDAQKSSEMP